VLLCSEGDKQDRVTLRHILRHFGTKPGDMALISPFPQLSRLSAASKFTRCIKSHRMLSSEPFREPIHILGGGSIGLLLASSIRQVYPSYPVRVILRESHRPHISKDRIAVCVEAHGRFRTGPDIPVEIEGSRSISNLVVATKAMHARQAIDSIKRRISDKTRIFLFCNGALAVRDELAEFPNLHTVLTTQGAYRDGIEDGLYHVVHAGHGHTLVEKHIDFANFLTAVGWTAESRESLDHDLWLKLATNCVINPLSAIHKCKNGDIVTRVPQFDKLMTSILSEIATIQTHVALTDMQDYVLQVMNETHENKSSMLQDVLSSRQTEVDYLNGYVLRKALESGVDVPINDDLVQQITSLQAS